MINLENKNDMITYEEACEILAIAKRVYPGFLDSVYVKRGRSFAYCRDFETGERYIEIPKRQDANLETIGTKIFSYVQDEFGGDYEVNLKLITINAFCHEIGHCIDFETHKMLGDDYYEDDADEEYEEFHYKAYEYYEQMDELEDYLLEFGFDIETEEFNRIKNELQEMQDELDYDYRHIITEYAADKLSMELMNGVLRGYLKK